VRNAIGCIALMTLAACNAATPDAPVIQTVDFTATAPMSASIDGKQWAANYTSVHLPDPGDLLFVYGSTSGLNAASIVGILMVFPKSLGEHAFIMPQRQALVEFGYDPWSTANGGGGSVTVHRVTGIFQFTAGSTRDITPKVRQVTAGRFALNF
jgi:hypothetical protein